MVDAEVAAIARLRKTLVVAAGDICYIIINEARGFVARSGRWMSGWRDK